MNLEERLDRADALIDSAVSLQDSSELNGELSQAIAICTSIIDDESDILPVRTSRAYILRAQAYRIEERTAAAITDVSKAIELNPENAELYTFRGMLYHDAGKLKGAISEYNHSIELDPDYSLSYHQRALVYFEQGDIKNALKDVTEAIRGDPENESVFNLRATILISLNMPQLAIPDFFRAHQANPNSPIHLINLGTAYKSCGQLEEAQGYYLEALKLMKAQGTANPRFLEMTVNSLLDIKLSKIAPEDKYLYN